MLRGLALGLTLSLTLTGCASAQERSVDFKGAMASAAYISCLSWTRDRIPISELAAEGDLIALPREARSNEDRWRLDFDGGHLLAVQHNDGSQACTIMVFGVSPEMVLADVEHKLVGDGLPEFIRFDFVRATSGDVVDRFYRQRADKKISAALTTVGSGWSVEKPSALLTFFHEKP